MVRVAPLLEEDLRDDEPEIDEFRNVLRERLGLSSEADSIKKLHLAVTSGLRTIVIRAPDGSAYQSLFNRFRLEDNPFWRGR